MSFETRDYAGAAAETTITSGITATDLSITITDSTGWPSGAASGPFYVVIDEGLSSEEKVLVASRTGSMLTVTSTSDRGADNTTATTHDAGASIKHCWTAQDAYEANYTMAQTIGTVTTKGDLLAATGANAFNRLGVGADDTVLVADSTQTTGIAWETLAAGTTIPAGTPGSVAIGDTASEGTAVTVARSDHKHGLTSAAPVSVSTAVSEGAATTPARSDHVHDIGSGAVDDLALFSGSIRPVYADASAPAGPATGQCWLDTDDNRLYVWDGTAWKWVGGNAWTASATGSSTTVAASTTGSLFVTTTRFDTDSIVDALNDEFEIPRTGYWLVTGQVRCTSEANFFWLPSLLVNFTTTVDVHGYLENNAVLLSRANFSTVQSFTSGDKLQVQVFNADGSSRGFELAELSVRFLGDT